MEVASARRCVILDFVDYYRRVGMSGFLSDGVMGVEVMAKFNIAV